MNLNTIDLSELDRVHGGESTAQPSATTPQPNPRLEKMMNSIQSSLVDIAKAGPPKHPWVLFPGM